MVCGYPVKIQEHMLSKHFTDAHCTLHIKGVQCSPPAHEHENLLSVYTVNGLTTQHSHASCECQHLSFYMAQITWHSADGGTADSHESC